MNNLEFYKKIFRDLDGNIEIREIGNSKIRRHFFKSIDDIETYKPPNDKNVYIGIFSRHGKKGNIAACISTGALWADMDNISVHNAKQIIKNTGMPQASILVSSGHGVHAYWILKEREKDVDNILKAICMRTGADTKSAEKARVLRVPNTMNVKQQPFTKCVTAEMNNKEYDLNLFKGILKKELNDIEKVKVQNKNKEDIKEFKNCSRACIRLMAKGTTEGHRNFALCKISKYLQLQGYTRRAALDIILRWNTLNHPPKSYNQVLTEFNKVWETDYKLLGCKFKKNKNLQIQNNYFCSMGECKYATFQDIHEIKSTDSSKIDNIIFQDDVYPKVKGLSLAIYFTIAKTEGITRDHLAKVVGIYIKNKNFIDSIYYLKELGLIKIIEGNRRVKEKDLIILGDMYNNGRGYTIVNNLLSESFLGNRITDTEYKLLVLLKSYCFTNDIAFPKVETLAKKIGKTAKTVSNSLKRLNKKLYVKNSYSRRENGTVKLHIKLLF
ncbi:hypothetical protein DP122_00345 [Clostridium tetani]|uniref:helix-turn-helix domain-containing protein n=1 Tax=Clostridium tetani TaxID=1513 RepID=UPI00100A308A|nr:helix-turn-helix domain-containing protein [Clostridium tetani]RXI57265.1 hypothetical protein DP122_00345 [Clostridium tetani]